MKATLHNLCVLTLCLAVCVFSQNARAQNSSKSMLINHGSSACGSQTAEQQFFTGALSGSATMAQTGSVGLPFGGVFASYNPADHKVYYADINGTTTKVYVVDYNFGGALTAPTAAAPNYTYNYTLNQLCFDNKGNNYGFKSFNPADGKARLCKVDITTGNEVTGTVRNLQFPAGNIPNTVGDGDIVVIPNGRLFAIFGNSPSRLYELSDPSNTGNMTVTYLASLPQVCYSIAFVDGNLMMAGSTGSNCYYYTWDINSNALRASSAFPSGKSSADMSNVTIAIGASKELLQAQAINTNTARLTYQIVVKNKGSLPLNNVRAVDDLAKVFGAANVSNVVTTFVSNPAGLQMNPSYDGVNDINLLLPGQKLENFPEAIDSVVLTVAATVTNLSPSKFYLNSAIASGDVGSGGSYMAVSDSSNNGRNMDPDGNCVSDDAGENIPTPFAFSGTLPTSGVELSGAITSAGVVLQWKDVANPATAFYAVERSTDGRRFETVGTLNLQGPSANRYSDAITSNIAPVLYYRVKATYPGGGIVYSNTVLIRTAKSLSVTAYPNPFNNIVRVEVKAETAQTATLCLRDVAGRILKSEKVQLLKGMNVLTLEGATQLTPGTYFASVTSAEGTTQLQLVKQ